MTPPTFLDANVPIYAAGKSHRLKKPCAQVLLLAAQQPAAFVTDAEVLQELLHRYLALRLWAEGKEVFHRFADLMRERVEPVHAADVERAARLADEYPELGARDLLHASVMQRLSVRRLVSADLGFDRLPGTERLDPMDVETWGEKLDG